MKHFRPRQLRANAAEVEEADADGIILFIYLIN